jgi:hypothetical protein
VTKAELPPTVVPSLPQYPPGIPMAERKQQAPMMKMLGRMMSVKLPKMKGKISPQNVKITHKKKKQTVKYY